MEIRINDIDIGDIRIRSLDIPPVVTQRSNVLDAQTPIPVVIQVGSPVVNHTWLCRGSRTEYY